MQIERARYYIGHVYVLDICASYYAKHEFIAM